MMHVSFSRRQAARLAAMQAYERWDAYAAERRAWGLPVQDRWDYVVTAALAAALADRPTPREP